MGKTEWGSRFCRAAYKIGAVNIAKGRCQIFFRQPTVPEKLREDRPEPSLRI